MAVTGDQKEGKKSPKSSALSTTFTLSRKMSQGTRADPYKIAILPGDGAGPEMMEATLEILQALSSMTGKKHKGIIAK